MTTSQIGHNRAPSAALRYVETEAERLSRYLSQHPSVDDADDAKALAELIETARRTLADMEDERDGRVRPLNEQVKSINDEYRLMRATMDGVLARAKSILTAFAAREEAARAAEAAEARRVAEALEATARAAEAAEIDAMLLGNGAKAATRDADAAFAEFKQADRAAARAENEIPVRLATGLGRSMSLRTVEVLTIKDAAAAIKAVGLTMSISDAILTASRAYRKLHGRLPDGVVATTERKI